MESAERPLLAGRFELSRELGHGGTGTVYCAFDRLRQQHVALKQLNRVDPMSLYLLKSEFRSIADLSHPNLARLGELFADGGSIFFTMELVEGVDFLGYVRPDDATSRDATTMVRPSTRPPAEPREPSLAATEMPFDPARLRHALSQLVGALAFLHAQGKVHRDVKPSNVLVDYDGRVVLLDFGLTADVLGLVDRDRGWIVGTPRYMAPEQVRDENVGPAADAYSLGVMLHEVLVGRTPVEGSAREILFAKQLYEPTLLSERYDWVPRDLDRLCLDLLARDPSARPTTSQILLRLGETTPEPMARSGFVGRSSELRQLHDAFVASTDHATAVWIRGESGVGKTALVKELTTQLRRLDPHVCVLYGRCFERENLPFNAIDAVVDALARVVMNLERPARPIFPDPGDAAALARVFPVLRRAKALEHLLMDDHAPLGSAQEQRRRAFAGLRSLLGALAKPMRIVIVIDDLQWADNDSRALIDELMHPPGAPALLWLGTMRSGAAFATPEDERDARTLELSGLPRKVAAELAEHALGDAGLDATKADSLVEEARGHPLFLLELVQLARGGGGRMSLDDALRTRVDKLPADVRRVLALICLARMPTRQGVIAGAAGVELPAMLAATDRLRREQLVRTEGTGEDDRIEPYHDRVREAVAEAIPSADRRLAHGELAGALTEAIREPRERAVLVHHLIESGQNARAADQALLAARESARALAFDQAAALFEIALRLGTHSAGERRALRLARAEALRDAGRGREAGEAFVEAASDSSGQEKLQMDVAAAEQWVACGHLDRGLELLSQALSQLGVRWPRTQAEALIALGLERAALAARGIDAARRHAPLAQDERLRLEIFQSIGAGLGSVDPLRAWIFQTRALRRILDTGEPDLLSIGFSLEVLLLGLDGVSNYLEVRRLVARLRELANESKSSRVKAWADLADGGGYYFVGRVDRAPGPLADAEQRFREEVRVDGAGLNIARILKVWTALFRGDLRALGRWIPEYERDALRRDDRYAQVSFNLAGHAAWLLDGDLARARAKTQAITWSPPGGTYHIQDWYRLMAHIEQALYAGRIEPAEQARLEQGLRALMRSLVFWRAEAIRVVARWLAARYRLALAEQGTDRERNLGRAMAMQRWLARERVPYAQIYAALVRAGVAHQRGNHAGARTELQVASELAEHQSFLGIAAMARRVAGDTDDTYFSAQGIAQPERLLGMYLPGFSTR